MDFPFNPGWQHSWTSLTLTTEEYGQLSDKYKSGDYQWNDNGDGTKSINLSAYKNSENGKLEKQINHPLDTNSQGMDFYQDYSMQDVENTLNNFDKYNNSADYGMLGDNCNAFTNTINSGNLPVSMADPDITGCFPNIGGFLDDKYFE